MSRRNHVQSTLRSVALTPMARAALIATGAQYMFRKSQYAPRMYDYTGLVNAANTTSWINGSATVGGYVTSHVCLDALAPFTEVALIFANESATAFTISGASVAPGYTLDDRTNSSYASRLPFQRVTFGGSNSGTVPAGTTNNASYLVSDFISVSSVARLASDATTWSVAGGKLSDCYSTPLLHIRVSQPTAAINSPLLGTRIGPNGAADAPFNPAQPTKSGRFISCQNSGAATEQLSIGAATAMTGTNYGPYSGIINMPIVGVIFRYPGGAMSVMIAGDSISAGAGLSGTAGNQRPWGKVATEEATLTNKPIEYCLLAKAGMSSDTYRNYFTRAIAAGIIPTHAVFAAFSPNNGASGFTTSSTNEAIGFLATCAAQNISPLLWTGLPVGLIAPQKLTTAGELERIAMNNGIRAKTFAGGGYDYIEMENAGSGALNDGVTPIASIPAGNADANDLHPNYAGDGYMRAALKSKLQTIQSAYFA